MENFNNSLDKSVFAELSETEAFEYIKAKYREEIKKEVEETLKPYWKENEKRRSS